MSRIIGQKSATRIRRFDTRIVLNNYWLPIADMEDQWDEMIDEQLGYSDDTEGGWADAIVKAERTTLFDHERSLASDKIIARKMQAIVDKETELALKEGRVVYRGRKSKPIKKYTQGK